MSKRVLRSGLGEHDSLEGLVKEHGILTGAT